MDASGPDLRKTLKYGTRPIVSRLRLIVATDERGVRGLTTSVCTRVT